ncbi:MAG: PD-(D/E)XK nuclease family protein, partial [bacterium]|nr:PD-(D/E)XK nuclease family protein [bacterium]
HTRLLYRLKKMSTLPQMMGTVVHDVISRVLKAIQTGREVPEKTAETYATELFDRHIEDSREKRWLRSASKHMNLFEHFYDQVIDEDAGRARVVESVQAFFDSEAFRTLKNIPVGQWLSVETLTSFQFNATKVWVSLDVAVRQDGGVSVYDWKTGREREADRLQLAVYALYAAVTWGVPVTKLRLQDVYLQAGVMRAVAVDATVLDGTREIISESISQMRGLLDDPNSQAASIDRFPMTDDRQSCVSCAFKSVCFPPGDAGEYIPDPVPGEKPVQLSLF